MSYTNESSWGHRSIPPVGWETFENEVVRRLCWIEKIIAAGVPRPGNPGTPAAPIGGANSLYALWLSLGNVGTETDFLETLKGEPGVSPDALPGKDAYQIWLDLGHSGSRTDFINFLRPDPLPGTPGRSAYQIWLSLGNSGSEEQFMQSLKGLKGDTEPGTPGLSAYDDWKSRGNVGTFDEFLQSLLVQESVSYVDAYRAAKLL